MIDRGEMLRRAALNAARLSRAAPLAAPFLSGMGAILMLHRVNRAPEKPLGINRHLTITPAFLDAVLTDLQEAGYRFITLDAMLEEIRRGEGRKLLTVTADDGYRDLGANALPILERHHVPVTIYVAPGLASGRIDLWWDLLEEIVTRRDSVSLDTPGGTVTFNCGSLARKFATVTRIHDYLTASVPEEQRQAVLCRLAKGSGIEVKPADGDGLMCWDEIRRIAAHPLVTIGAHTVNHYNLRRLEADEAYREIANAADMIAEETGRTPDHMAYPYGYRQAVGPREVELARKAGFRSAVTTRHGVLQPQHAHHLHALPRISVNGRYQQVAHVRTMLSGLTTVVANSGRCVVTV